MKSLASITAALCLAFAASASAQQTAASTTPEAPPAAAAATAAAPAQKLICRSERVTGTRNTKKICRTQEQIDADKRAAQEFTRTGQRQTSAEAGGG